YGVWAVKRFQYIRPEFKQVVERITDEEERGRQQPGGAGPRTPLYAAGRRGGVERPRLGSGEGERGQIGRGGPAQEGAGSQGNGGSLVERLSVGRGGGGKESGRGTLETSGGQQDRPGARGGADYPREVGPLAKRRKVEAPDFARRDIWGTEDV